MSRLFCTLLFFILSSLFTQTTRADSTHLDANNPDQTAELIEKFEKRLHYLDGLADTEIGTVGKCLALQQNIAVIDAYLKSNTSFEDFTRVQDLRAEYTRVLDKHVLLLNSFQRFMVLHPKYSLAGILGGTTLFLGAAFYIAHKVEQRIERDRLKEFESEISEYNADIFTRHLLSEHVDLLSEHLVQALESKPSTSVTSVQKNYDRFASYLPTSAVQKKEALESMARIYFLSTSEQNSVTRHIRALHLGKQFAQKYPRLNKVVTKLVKPFTYDDLVKNLDQHSKSFSKNDYSAMHLMHATVLKMIENDYPEFAGRVTQLQRRVASRLSRFVNDQFDKNIEPKDLPEIFPTDGLRKRVASTVKPEHKKSVYKGLLDLYQKLYDFLESTVVNLAEMRRYKLALYNLDRYKNVFQAYAATQHEIISGDISQLTPQLLGMPRTYAIRNFIEPSGSMLSLEQITTPVAITTTPFVTEIIQVS